jgi:tetratricopeptide (TPR) repeat protein
MMRYPVLGMLLVLLSVEIASAYEAVVNEARSALADGRPAIALERLQAEELTHSGEPTFDYWLGVAALRAGEPTYALVALDRVLYQRPNHAGARLERVAALLQLDQRNAAARELERLRGLSPPEEAQAAMARYQAVIDRRRNREDAPDHQVRIGADFGYDSNPQRFPNEIAVDPLRPGIREEIEQLADQGLISDSGAQAYEPRVFAAESSAYQRVQARYRGGFPYNDDTRLLLSGIAQSQRYVEKAARDFDLTLGQLQLGLERQLAPERQLTVTATTLRAWQGPGLDNLLTRWGGEVSLRHPFGVDDTLTWRLGGNINRFEAGDNDYDTARLGVRWSRSQGDWRTRLGLRVGREWASADRDGGDEDNLRLTAGVDYRATARQTLRLRLEQRLTLSDDRGYALYNEFTPLRRQDQVTGVRATWLYALNREWLVNIGADFERRRSNIDFFDTRREQLELGLQYRF